MLRRGSLLKMKKFLPALVLLSIFAVLLLPLAVSAQEEPIECCKMRREVSIGGETAVKDAIVGPRAMAVDECPLGAVTRITQKWGVFCIINTIQNFVDWFFAVLVAVAVLLAIIGAFNILTAGGSPEKVNTGRNYIMFAAIGLAIAFIARAVPSIVKAIMGF